MQQNEPRVAMSVSYIIKSPLAIEKEEIKWARIKIFKWIYQKE